VPRGEYDRSARRAQTRALLLQAAATVYARSGFDGATLDEVAAEAGFSKGAVYDHFGSKENLLMALMGEHLAEQVAEQLSLFDRGRSTWERPLSGSARWMEHVREEPDSFRLFVELWSYAQRDERLRLRLGDGVALLRATFARFAATGAQDAGVEQTAQAAERFAAVVVALGVGLPMMELIEPGTVPTQLLGSVLAILIRSLERDPEARRLLADPGLGAGAFGLAAPSRD
jgi:AcrR family transcriptional regulator